MKNEELLLFFKTSLISSNIQLTTKPNSREGVDYLIGIIKYILNPLI
jgi:hypothetical protein